MKAMPGVRWGLAPGVLSVLLLAATDCAPRGEWIEEAFAKEYGCGMGLATKTEGWVVSGCGQQATYECEGYTCREREPEGTTNGAPPATMDKADVQRRQAHATPLSSDIRVETRKGKAVLLLEMRLDRSSFFQLTATPEESLNFAIPADSFWQK